MARALLFDEPMELIRAWLDAVDRPAREALELSRRSWTKTSMMALAGAALVAASSLSAEALASANGALRFPEGRLVQAFFESLFLVIPSAAVLFAFARLRLSARALFSATAVGLLVAGLVTLSTLPLMGYLVLVSRATPYFRPPLVLPLLALFAVGGTIGRVLEAVEDRPIGERAARLFYLFFGLTFAARAAAQLGLI